MSDAGTTAVPLPGGTEEALPGEVVRTLFDRNEQVLEALRSELDEAIREADAAEALVRAHPALGLLAPDEVEVLVPGVDRTTGSRALGARRAAAHHGGHPPAEADAGGSGRTRCSGTDGSSGTEQTGVSRLVTSHWVWKAGIAVTLIALLLLKFG